MSSPALLSLKQQRTSLLNSQASLAGKMGNNPSAEQRKSYDQLTVEIDSLSARISSVETVESKLSASAQRKSEQTANEVFTAVRSVPAIIQKHLGVTATGAELNQRAKSERAVRKLLSGIQDAETRDITTATDASGAAFVSQLFDSAISQATKYTAPVLDLVKVFNGNHQTKFVVSDATNLKMLLSPESTTVAAPASVVSNAYSQTPTSIALHIPGTDPLVVTVTYSTQELADADNLEAYLSEVFGEAVARAREAAVTLGVDGAGTALPNSPVGGLVGVTSVGQQTAAIANGIDTSDFIKLFESFSDFSYINPRNPNVSVMLHPWTILYLMGLKDGSGRPKYAYDAQDSLKSIFGIPVIPNNSLTPFNTDKSETTANSIVALAGNFRAGYSVLQGTTDTVVLRERFIDTNMMSSVLYTRFGTAQGVSGAIKSLKIAAS